MKIYQQGIETGNEERERLKDREVGDRKREREVMERWVIERERDDREVGDRKREKW